MSIECDFSLNTLRGKTVLITGANSGLGLETSIALIHAGATVIMACRSQSKAKAALAAKNIHRSNSVLIKTLDLADLASIKAFAEDIKKNQIQIDVLVNNAGIMAVPYSKTADGFESQMGTNHLGHFALTAQILDSMSATGRIINLSSMAHRMSRGIKLDDLNWVNRRYRTWQAYGDSKLANLLFTHELAKRLTASGSSIITAAAHPGYADTNLQLVAAEEKQSSLQKHFWKALNLVLAQPAHMGALPTLYAASSDDIKNGDFAGPSKFYGTRGQPKRVRARKLAYNDSISKALWEKSEALTGINFL